MKNHNHPPAAGSLQSLQDQYMATAHHAGVTDHDYWVINQVARQSGQNAWQRAGAMYLDTAMRSEATVDQQAQGFSMAQNLWQNVLDTGVRAGVVTAEGIRASIGLATLPSCVSIVFKKELPDKPKVQTMYKQIWEAGLQASKLEFDASKKNDQWTVKNTSRILTELSVLLLHQRFSAQRVSDNSILALPARYSQQHNVRLNQGKGKYKEMSHWDISIFTQDRGEGPVLSRKVQVKFSGQVAVGGRNVDDITLVYAQNDLIATKHERAAGRMLVKTIPFECQAEEQGRDDPGFVQRLELRTSRLLDILR